MRDRGNVGYAVPFRSDNVRFTELGDWLWYSDGGPQTKVYYNDCYREPERITEKFRLEVHCPVESALALEAGIKSRLPEGERATDKVIGYKVCGPWSRSRKLFNHETLQCSIELAFKGGVCTAYFIQLAMCYFMAVVRQEVVVSDLWQRSASPKRITLCGLNQPAFSQRHFVGRDFASSRAYI